MRLASGNREINFGGMHIVLMSEDVENPELTVIDCAAVCAIRQSRFGNRASTAVLRRPWYSAATFLR